MANRFYRTIYMPQFIHLDVRMRNEGMNNEAVLLPFQTPPRASIDDLINALFDLKPLSSMWKNLHPKEVHITHFLPSTVF